MENNKRDSDMEEWDWEVLIDNPLKDGDDDDNIGNSKEGHVSFTVSSEEEEGDTNSLIRCDYFSLEPEKQQQQQQLESSMEMESEKEKGSQVGSWMDPGQAEFPNRRSTSKADSHITGKRRRNSPSPSDEYGNSGCSCGNTSDRSDDGLLELLQHSHSQCCPRQYDDSNIGSHILESFPSLTLPESGNMEFDNPQPQQERQQPSDAHVGLSFDATVDDPVPAHEPAERNVHSETADGKEISPPSAWSWRRVPLEVFKYCMLRVAPVTVSVWSLSVAAAAVLGFVLVRRRWLSKMKTKMKRNSHSLHLNITVDDKKVSQFMSRAARLNEAFSVVKRVPVMRPSLPAPGVALWPMMNLR